MLECLILGDSIAVGTHQTRPECVSYAKGGITSQRFNRIYTQKFNSDTVIISLGSNDHSFIHTKDELIKLRQRIRAKKVYWILPAGNAKNSGVHIMDIQLIVEEIAHRYQDWIIKIPNLSEDGVHPTGKGYQRIAEITK